MKKVLITGGAGFVGYHLALRLVAAGYDVTLADNFSRGKRDEDLAALLLNEHIHLIECDLTKEESWHALGSGYDQVYHLASVNGTKLFYDIPQEVLRVGILSTILALEWFRTHNNIPNAKFLYTSSNEAYAGALEIGALPIPTPENVPLVITDTYNPRWSYGGQKLIGELLCINYAKAYNFRMSIVRPHNFYGPRAGYHHVIPQLIERITKQEEPFARMGADETRSFCYIDDAVEAIQNVMESTTTDQGTYHIGSSEEMSINDVYEALFTELKWRPKQLVEKESPAGSVKRRLPDVSKIKKDTGWEARTIFADGLKKTASWYLSHPHQQ